VRKHILLVLGLLGLTLPVALNAPDAQVSAATQATTAIPSRINPETDLQYLGAFRLPDETSNGTSWSYGGHGMGYYPEGDPAGDEDGFPGSLFSISHPYQNYVSEFSIPVPVISPGKSLGDLPVATTLQPFADVTEGRQSGGLTGATLGDIHYYPMQGAQSSDKLYWVMYEYYLPDQDEVSFGWGELDFSNLQSQGAWRLDGFPFSATSKYLFDIPRSWADAHTPGNYLAAGRCRIVNDGSWGPALYAFGPWNDGNPPPDGASLDAVQLLKYGNGLTLRDFSHAEEWQDGAWLTIGDKAAVIFAGVRALRTSASGQEYYGEPGVDGCGSKGYHAEPYYGAVLFYDPYLIAQVAGGTLESDEVQPYAELNVERHLFKQGCRRGILGGVGYDRQRNLLYVMEKYVEGYYDRKPIVHVWRAADGTQPPDLEAPSVPANLRTTDVTSATVSLSWDAALDNTQLAGYIVYRNGEPMATSVEPWRSDDKVNPSASYTYTVRAWDARSNSSDHSAPLTVTTPAGTDTRAPIVTGLRITDIASHTASVSWRTDEPATSRARYEIVYSGNWITVENTTLTTEHQLTLTGLTPGETYSCKAASVDGTGNEYEHPGKHFSTPYSGSGGFAPVLKGIGAQRVAEGDLLAFSVSADDQDSDALFYSATDWPSGASFDSEARRFSWRPGSNDVGVRRVTFEVSDGSRADSESVAIFVLPELALRGRPADRAIHLGWTYGGALPAMALWRIEYYSQTMGSTVVATDCLTHTARAYTLHDLENYTPYTITLSSVGVASPLSATVCTTPTDRFVYLPLVFREH